MASSSSSGYTSASASSSSSSSASAPSPASWDASTVLYHCRSILELDSKGQTAEALAMAAALADAQPSSAVATNLAGGLYHNAGFDAFKRSESREVVEGFYQRVVMYYAAASRLAPTCAVTAMYHADALAACERNVEAYAEYQRAASMPDPADPAEYNAGLDFNRSAADSKRLTVAEAQRSLKNFQGWITRSYVPRQAQRVMQDLKSTEIRTAVQAVKDANGLAKAYPFCARAQLLRAYALLEQANSLLPQNLDNTPALERALAMVTEASAAFDRSLLIALFRAKLLCQLHRNDDAAEECVRALSIRRPGDPAKENVLRIAGDVDRKSRIASVKQEVMVLFHYLRPGSIVTLAQNGESDEGSDDSEEEYRHRQSTMYGHKALHIPVRFEAYKPFVPLQNPPQEIHFVAGEVVPQEIVNIFALHCQARSKCSARKTVCHICSFEGNYDARVESSEMSGHYSDKHVLKEKHQADAPIPLPAPYQALEPIVCNEENCAVRTRTTKDVRLHYYFVHRLPTDWWIT